MKRASAVMAVALVGACAGGTTVQPVDISAPAPAASAAVTMECVTRELDSMGYEVPANQAGTMQVTGIRINEKPWFVRWLYGNTADQITATIDNGQLRVSASSSDPNDIGDDTMPTTAASDVAARNAQSVLDTCARAG